MRPRSTFTHLFRVATLVLPSLIAWLVALSAPHRDELTRAVTQALAPVWIALAAALALRLAGLLVERRRNPSVAVLARLDLLTGTGSTLAWTSALAVILAVRIGYASLAVVGMLGGALLHLVVLYACIALRSADPIRGGKVTRTLTPARPTEGADVTQEITVENAKIPLGYRLFVSARVGPRWPTSRHLLEAADSGSTVAFESEVGPAVRGEHEVEPVELWLEDTFGLTRSAVAHVAAGEELTVAPKLHGVDKKLMPLLARGLGERTAKTTNRLPTEGNLDLREYRDGDDVRRIHWIRSLAANQLIVRLPDEIPPDRPKVRIILDTFFPEAAAFEGETHERVLDAMVAVWLAVGRAFAERGIRTRLVLAAKQNGEIAARALDMPVRETGAALALGATAAWQSHVQVSDLWTDEATFIVSPGVHVMPPASDKFRWIIVAPSDANAKTPPLPSAAQTPFPLGHRENRLSHRAYLARNLARARQDQFRAIRTIQTNVAPPPAGSLVATALEDGICIEAVS